MTEQSTRIADQLKSRIDDLDLDRRLNEFVEQAEQGLRRAVSTAGDFASERTDDIERWLDVATSKINERTEGKYADHVTRVRDQVSAGVARLAKKAPTSAE